MITLRAGGGYFVNYPPFKIFKHRFDDRAFLIVNSYISIDTIDTMLNSTKNLSGVVLLQAINVSDVNYSRLKAYRDYFSPVRVGIYVEDAVLHEFIIASSVLLGAETILLPQGYGSTKSLHDWIETLAATVEVEVIG